MDDCHATIREYRPSDEVAWLRCRAVAFLDTAYYDDVRTEKPKYENPSVELVAAEEDRIVGLLDIEHEVSPGDVCSNRPGLGGMIWDIAVHPDRRRCGVASRLLRGAVNRLRGLGVTRTEAWTRDDEAANLWYAKQGFKKIDSYLHVYVLGRDGAVTSTIPGLKPVCTFAHYVGENTDEIRAKFERVHECSLFELRLDADG